MQRATFASLVAVVWLSAAAARADGGGLADAGEVSALDGRLREVEDALADAQRPARTYFTSWLAAMSAMVVGQGTIGLLSDDRAQRESMFLGAGMTAVGIGILLVTPMPGRHGADELRGMPGRSFAEKRAKLARGESLLAGEAESARVRRAWYQHVLVAAVSAGVGVYLGARYPDDVWTTAVPSALSTLAVMELQIWTRPTAAVGRWERYRTSTPSVVLAPTVAPQAFGIGVQASF